MSKEKYVGLDVHKATIVIAVLNAVGQVVMQTVIATDAQLLREFFKGLSGTVAVALEEARSRPGCTRCCGHWLKRWSFAIRATTSCSRSATRAISLTPQSSPRCCDWVRSKPFTKAIRSNAG